MTASLKIILRVTDRCNQDCAYCYVDRVARRSSQARLSLASLARLYGELLAGGQFGHVHFVWHGGEPTLVGHEYLQQALELQLQRPHLNGSVKIENSIQTNTTALHSGMI